MPRVRDMLIPVRFVATLGHLSMMMIISLAQTQLEIDESPGGALLARLNLNRAALELAPQDAFDAVPMLQLGFGLGSACLAVQLGGLASGVTFQRDSHNFLLIVINTAGSILLSRFMRFGTDHWEFWLLFWPFLLLPCALEILAVLRVGLFKLRKWRD